MQKALLPPVKHHNATTSSYIPADLSLTGYVYVQVDGHRTLLQQPYSGTFRIISAKNRYFTLDINGRSDTVTVDRLKPAYVGTNCAQNNSSLLHPILTTHPNSYHFRRRPPEAVGHPDLQNIYTGTLSP